MSYKLHDACRFGNLSLIKQIAVYEDFNVQDYQGLYPLDIAVNFYESYKYLFETFKLDPFKRNGLGMNSVAHSIAINQIDVFKLIMDSKEIYTNLTFKELICDIPCSSDGLAAIDLVFRYNQALSKDMLKLMLSYIKNSLNETLCRRLFFHALKDATNNCRIVSLMLIWRINHSVIYYHYI